MKSNSIKSFLGGLLTGIVVINLILLLIHGGFDFFFKGKPDLKFAQYNTSKNIIDSIEPAEELPEGKFSHITIRNLDANHQDIWPTYYIDTTGFEELLHKSKVLRIDLGCNGEEGRASHQFNMLFSGRTDSGKAVMVMQRNTSATAGSAVKYAYLDKTCPCPMQGTTCPTCPRATARN